LVKAEICADLNVSFHRIPAVIDHEQAAPSGLGR